MIGIFQPVNNAFGFEVREVKLKPKFSTHPLPIRDFSSILHELPVFKPLKHCNNKTEYRDQFKGLL